MDLRPLIERKKTGGTLSTEEIDSLVAGYCAARADEAQVAALLMAIWWAGMSEAEATALTLAMAHSGEMLDFSDLPLPVADKHSTGGVGDKTTLVLAPLVAACGVPVAKMSGRALGHTGGTIDKLEAIPGLRTALTPQEMRAQVARIGLVIAAQSANLVPADKLLYALRDRIGVVDSMPLIAASVMSKKLAAGASVIVLDVKAGSGAFMRTPAQALTLARLMVGIGRGAGRRMAALVTDMNRPLGRAVGNRAELVEALETLHGRGPTDLLELSLLLGERMVYLAGAAPNLAAARHLLQEALASGAGVEKLAQMVEAQGGDPEVVRYPERLAPPPVTLEIAAGGDGYLHTIEPYAVGAALRRAKDAGDHTVEMHLLAAIGDRVRLRQPLAVLGGSDRALLTSLLPDLAAAFTLTAWRPRRKGIRLGEVG